MQYAKQLFEMAADFEVELSDIGLFTDSGNLDILYNKKRIALFDLDFLHEGVPRKFMQAEWKAPQVKEPILPEKAGPIHACLKYPGPPGAVTQKGSSP